MRKIRLNIIIGLLSFSSFVWANFQAPVEEVYQTSTEAKETQPTQATRNNTTWGQAIANAFHPHAPQKQAFVSAEEASSEVSSATNVRETNTTKLLNKIEVLEEEVAHLRGEVEVTQHEVKQLNLQQARFNREINKPSSQSKASTTENEDITGFNESTQRPLLETDPSSSVGSSAPEKPTSGTPAFSGNEANQVLQEQQAYKLAYKALRDKHYQQAQGQFQRYIEQYPQGIFIANAHYWLGELYLVTGEEKAALNAFDTVITHYPHSVKVPDALFKKGYLYLTKGQRNSAIQLFNFIQHKYPETPAAHLATQKINQLQSTSSQ